MIYRLVNAFFKSVFYFLNEVRQLHVKEIEQMHGGDADSDTDTETDQIEPKPDPFVKTNIKSEWTPEKTIKITLDIIIGSDGLAVFMHPFSQPRPPTPPPHPIPDPVDDTPTIDEFHIDVDFGDRAPAAAAVENDDVNVVEE
jgi:hypothetical protein